MTNSQGPWVPDIGKTNVVLPTDDTVELEKSMSKSNASLSAWARQEALTANQMQKLEESQQKDLIALTRQGSALYVWNKERIEAKRLDEDYMKLMLNAELRLRTDAQTEGLAGSLEQTEDRNKFLIYSAEAWTNMKGEEVNSDDVREALDSAAPFKTDYTSIRQLSGMLGGNFEDVKNILEYKNKKGEWEVLAKANNLEDHERSMAAFRMLIWMQARRLTDNKLVIRRELLPALRQFDQQERTRYANKRREVNDEIRKIEDAADLALGIETGGADYFMREFNVSLGKFPKGDGTYDYTAASIHMTNRVVDLITTGQISTQAAGTILTYKPPFGTHPGQNKEGTKTWAELNGPSALRIQRAINQFNTDKFNADADKLKNAKLKHYHEWYDGLKEGGVDSKAMKEYRASFREKFGPSATLPQEFLSLETVSEQDSGYALDFFKGEVSNGNAWNLEYAKKLHAGITHPDDMQEADQLLERIKAMSMDTDNRDNFILGRLNETFEEKVIRGNVGSTAHQNATRNLVKIYNDEYAKAKGANQSNTVAEAAARKAVNDAIKDDKNLTVFTGGLVSWDTQAETDLKKTINAAKKDPSIIYQDQPMPGEEEALKQAARYYEKGGEPINYYIQLARNIKGKNWKQVMDLRWELAGNKAKRTDLEDLVNLLPPSEQKLLNQNNPSTTLRVVLENSKFADTLNKDSENNLDYNYIRREGGEDPVETEKPLTEMTVKEVLDLAGEGYFDFGAAGLDGIQVIEALEGMSEDWDFNTIFNEEFQKKLIKGVLRSKANKQNAISGVDTAWMSLTNINEELASAWIEQTGIKDPYRQPDTMPEAVAMAAVDLHLPDMA